MRALLLVGWAGLAAAAGKVAVDIDTETVLGSFEPSFASITFDIQNFIGFKIYPWQFDWSNQQLRGMVGALAPMTVRCGGTWEDGILWEGGPQVGRSAKFKYKPGMMAHNLTLAEWSPFAEFMQTAGVDMVVGLNALLRHWGNCSATPDKECTGDISWDPTNAVAFIKHNRAAGLRIYGYELGNEPAVWNYTWHTPIVTSKQHAADFAILRGVLETEYAAEQLVPKVVGPDTTWGAVGDELPNGGRNPIAGSGGPNRDYWNTTLQHDPAIDVAAFHYYALLPGLIRNWKDFVYIAKNRSMCTAVAAHAKDLASSPLAGRVPLWLGEGGASYGGISGSNQHDWLRVFGGALSYLEDLGCAAQNGAAVFARQQLSNFIDYEAGVYRGLPAYFVSILWKKLVGTSAFAISSSSDDAVHTFAFSGLSGDITTTQKGSNKSIVVAAVNWDLEGARQNSTLVISGCAHSADVYMLTPVHTGPPTPLAPPVVSGGIAINGVQAEVDAQGKVPSTMLQPLRAVCQQNKAHVTLPPLTAAFVVIEKGQLRRALKSEDENATTMSTEKRKAYKRDKWMKKNKRGRYKELRRALLSEGENATTMSAEKRKAYKRDKWMKKNKRGR